MPVVAEGMIVLEAPTREDVERGEALEDRAGDEFKNILRDAGIELNKMVVIHAVGCMQPRPERDADMRAALTACRKLFLDISVKLPSSLPVLVVGKWAAMQLTGKKRAIGSIRGFYGEEDFIGSQLAVSETTPVAEVLQKVRPRLPEQREDAQSDQSGVQ